MKMQSKNVEWIYLCAMFVILKLHLEPLWKREYYCRVKGTKGYLVKESIKTNRRLYGFCKKAT